MKTGEVPYVHTHVQKYGQEWRLYNMVIKKLNSQKVSSKLIKRQATKCNIHYPIQVPLEEAKYLRQAAKKKYQ